MGDIVHMGQREGHEGHRGGHKEHSMEIGEIEGHDGQSRSREDVGT